MGGKRIRKWSGDDYPMGTFPVLVKESRFLEVKQQRDELLAACERLRQRLVDTWSFLEAHGFSMSNHMRDLAFADLAIAKVKGDQG